MNRVPCPAPPLSAQMRPRRGAQQGGGRAEDGGQRRAQLVADHGQKLGALPLQLLQRRQVLQRDDQRLDTDRRVDRRGVDQRPDAPAVRDGQHDLLGAHGLGRVEVSRQRQLAEGDHASIRPVAGNHLQQLLRRAARRAETFDNPPRLVIDRHELAGPGIEDRHAHRRGLDQSLHVRPGPSFVAVRAGVHDGRRRLRGEQHRHFFVLARELSSALLVAEEERADVLAPVAHRRSQHGVRGYQVGKNPERTDVGGQIAQSQGSVQVPQVLEEPRSVGPLDQLPAQVGCHPGGDEVLDLPRSIDRGEQAELGAGQGAGALDDLPQDGLRLEASADAQHGRDQLGGAVPRTLHWSPARWDRERTSRRGSSSRHDWSSENLTHIRSLRAHTSHWFR